MKLKLSIIPLAVLVLSVTIFVHCTKAGKDESFSTYVDKDGGITRPVDFKEKWT